MGIADIHEVIAKKNYMVVELWRTLNL
jgi:hypothetical protein